MSNFICIDIGGTLIKYGLSSEYGKFIETYERPTLAKEEGGLGIVNKIIDIVEFYIKYKNIEGIAISSAGMVDPKEGKIIYSLEDSIPNYTNTEIKKIIENKYNIITTVENDVNCASLGEFWLSKKDLGETIFALTVGTSVGGCIMHKGEIITGASFSAGEVAYMQNPKGRFHDICSTTKLVEDVARKKGIDKNNLNGKIIFDLAKKEDRDSQTSIYDLMDNLADGLSNIVAVLNPHSIILGGGIMTQEVYLRPILEKALKKRLVPNVYYKTNLHFATQGNNAGMLGALYHHLKTRDLL